MEKIKVMSVFGTRPEAIKMAPLVLELQKHPEIDSTVCVTAQHREMLDSVMDCFGISADDDLNIMSQGQTLSDITIRALKGLEEVILRRSPDIVLVHGDTTTTFAGALAAFYTKTPVGHVEAGLRTYDRWSPFPEEMNRCMVSRIAECHFCPTAQNAENLRHEGVSDGVYITGNTVIDAMRYTIGDGEFVSSEMRALPLGDRRVIAMTCHRRENYGEPMENIFRAVRRVAERYGDCAVVYPVHLSPVVREAANRLLSGLPNVFLVEPLDVFDMHRLLRRSYLVMTDSGGLQEEAPALGRPVLVLRRETERPEAAKAGTVRIAGTDEDEIFALACRLLDSDEEYQKMARAVNPYGDGNACPRIAQALLHRFGLGERPEDFRP